MSPSTSVKIRITEKTVEIYRSDRDDDGGGSVEFLPAGKTILFRHGVDGIVFYAISKVPDILLGTVESVEDAVRGSAYKTPEAIRAWWSSLPRGD